MTSFFLVDWNKEIEEELKNQKRKKKSTSSISSLPELTAAAKPTATIQQSVISVIPAPLPKPHSPKNSTSEAKKVVPNVAPPLSIVTNMDLLGLDTVSITQNNQTADTTATTISAVQKKMRVQ